VISEGDDNIQMEIKLGDADLRAVPPAEMEVDDLVESDSIISLSEAKSIVLDALLGVWRLIRFVAMVTVPIISGVVGWYAGRDDLKSLSCTVVTSPECTPAQPQAHTTLVIEPRRFDPPAQRYALPKFIGDDSPAKLPAPVKAQRQTRPGR
jgi:hypothetical protein